MKWFEKFLHRLSFSANSISFFYNIVDIYLTIVILIVIFYNSSVMKECRRVKMSM